MCNGSSKDLEGYKVVQSRPYFRNKPIILITGPPGAGKSTQCDRIVEKFKFARMHVGELLQQAAAAQNKQGEYLRNLIAQREVVPNEFIIDFLLKAMYKVSHTCTGVIVDGFPRDIEQGPLFEEKIASIDMIINFECPEDILYERISHLAEISELPSEDDAETEPEPEPEPDPDIETETEIVIDPETAFRNRLQNHNDKIRDILKPYEGRVENIRSDKEPHVVFLKIEGLIVNLIWDKDCALLESLKKAKPKLHTQPKKCDPPNSFY